jgi:hypothetical protein
VERSFAPRSWSWFVVLWTPCATCSGVEWGVFEPTIRALVAPLWCASALAIYMGTSATRAVTWRQPSHRQLSVKSPITDLGRLKSPDTLPSDSVDSSV